MSLVSNPWVTKVTIIGDQLLLTVQVDEFVTNESIEMSGYVTQHGGAIATVFDVQPVTRNPDGSATMYVTATPAQGFQEGYDVTVVLRAARVWMTVLKQQQDGTVQPQAEDVTERPPAGDGTVWNSIRATGWETAGGSPMWIGGGTPAGSGPSFRRE